MKLSDKSLQQLWELFPIVLKPHNPEYFAWFNEESARLQKIAGQYIKRISHIGSTAVPGLLAKPTVDILLETDPGSELASRLIADNWIMMSDNVYCKGYTENGFAEKVYHLHVRRYADHDELYFRDCLLAYKGVAAAYGKLKLSLFKRFEHDRDAYTNAKTDFVKSHTAKARQEFPGRYMPEKKWAHIFCHVLTKYRLIWYNRFRK